MKKDEKLEVGTKLRRGDGAQVEVLGFLAEGGQARTYRAKVLDTEEHGVVKVFLAALASADTHDRNAWLLESRLGDLSSVLVAPTHRVEVPSGAPATWTPWVAGPHLEQFLFGSDAGASSYEDLLLLALDLAVALERLHARGVAHGDLHPGNVLVVVGPDGAPEARLIDFDNFSAEALPVEAQMLGARGYLPPEAFRDRRGPDEFSDRFGLALLVHLALLLEHPGQGWDVEPDEAMLEGWRLDPARPSSRRASVVPLGLLPPNLQRLLRLGLGPDRSLRPAPGTWVRALVEALWLVDACPAPECARPLITHAASRACPSCGRAFQVLRILDVEGDLITSLDRPLSLGRAHIPGGAGVSRAHVSFLRLGPQTRMTVHGPRTERLVNERWVPLKPDETYCIRAGDVIRIAGSELRIVA